MKGFVCDHKYLEFNPVTDGQWSNCRMRVIHMFCLAKLQHTVPTSLQTDFKGRPMYSASQQGSLNVTMAQIQVAVSWIGGRLAG